jgi:hypothetical protein
VKTSPGQAPRTAAGDERDLAVPGTAGPKDDALFGIDLQQVRMGSGETGQAIGDDVPRVVDELLGSSGRGRHRILPQLLSRSAIAAR